MTKITTLPALIVCFALFFSCNKEQPICFTPPQSTLIRIVDKEGTDLLNPSSVNGYKFSDISISYTKSNVKKNSNVKLDSLPNSKTYFLSTDISWNADKGQEFSLILSSTITDNIYLRYDQVSEKGCGFYKFVEFKYNNVIYNQTKTGDSFRSFVIVK